MPVAEKKTARSAVVPRTAFRASHSDSVSRSVEVPTEPQAREKDTQARKNDAQARKAALHALARLNALVGDEEFLRELRGVKDSPSAIAAGRIEFALGPKRIVGYTAGVPAGEQLVATALIEGKYWVLSVQGCDQTRRVGAA